MKKLSNQVLQEIIRLASQKPEEERFTEWQKAVAFYQAEKTCECCGKELVREQKGRNSGPNCWEAHHDETLGGRMVPVILCASPNDGCHLHCGHNGDYLIKGIVPKTCNLP